MSDDHHSRGFDWGPPDAGRLEPAKEWVVHVLLLLLIGLGTWFLIDSGSTGDQPVSEADMFSASSIRRPPASQTGALPSPSGVSGGNVEMRLPASEGTTALAGVATLPGPLKPVFLVQLGAFGEEEAALEAQTRLRKKGYVASLTTPNEEYEMYRLLLGPFSEEKQADDTARKLNEMDFPCFVIESL